jgi:hypothetical protein
MRQTVSGVLGSLQHNWGGDNLQSLIRQWPAIEEQIDSFGTELTRLGDRLTRNAAAQRSSSGHGGSLPAYSLAASTTSTAGAGGGDSFLKKFLQQANIIPDDSAGMLAWPGLIGSNLLMAFGATSSWVQRLGIGRWAPRGSNGRFLPRPTGRWATAWAMRDGQWVANPNQAGSYARWGTAAKWAGRAGTVVSFGTAARSGPGRLRLDAESFIALAEHLSNPRPGGDPAACALANAGVLVDGQPHASLRAGLAAVANPLASLQVLVTGQGGVQLHQGWLSILSAVLADVGDGTFDFIGLGTEFVPTAVARMTRLRFRPSVEDAVSRVDESVLDDLSAGDPCEAGRSAGLSRARHRMPGRDPVTAGRSAGRDVEGARVRDLRDVAQRGDEPAGRVGGPAGLGIVGPVGALGVVDDIHPLADGGAVHLPAEGTQRLLVGRRPAVSTAEGRRAHALGVEGRSDAARLDERADAGCIALTEEPSEQARLVRRLRGRGRRRRDRDELVVAQTGEALGQ